MKDADAIDFLADKLKKQALVAIALGVSEQTIHNWKKRRIPAWARTAVAGLIVNHGGALPAGWVIPRPPPRKTQHRRTAA